MGRAKFDRKRAAGGMGFDQDDGGAPLQPPAHHGAEPDRTAAGDEQGRTWPAGKRAHDGPCPSLDSAPERRGMFEREIVRDRHDVTRIGKRVGGERGLTEETARDRRALVAQCRRAIGATSGEVEHDPRPAIGRVAGEAGGALAARPKAEGDAITDGQAGDLRADALDDPRPLVAEHGGTGGHIRIAATDVGVAQSDRHDPYQHFVSARLIEPKGVKFEVAVRAGCKSSPDLDRSVVHRLEASPTASIPN